MTTETRELKQLHLETQDTIKAAMRVVRDLVHERVAHKLIQSAVEDVAAAAYEEGYAKGYER